MSASGSLPIRSQGLRGPARWDTGTHPDLRAAPAHSVFGEEDASISLCELLNQQLRKPKQSSPTARCLARGRRPGGRRFSAPSPPPPPTLVTCLSHCSFFKKSSAACLGRGREGGSQSPARAAKGGLTFTGRGGGLRQSPNSPRARCPPAGLRPHRRGQCAVSARAPAPTTGAAAPSCGPVRPFPLGPERRPGSSRPGVRNSSPRAEPGKGQKADPRLPPVRGRGVRAAALGEPSGERRGPARGERAAGAD